MARKYHPDGTEGDTEKFKRIVEAYQVLSDGEKRRDYDRTTQGPFKQNYQEYYSSTQQEQQDFEDLEDIFSHFGFGSFGGHKEEAFDDFFDFRTNRSSRSKKNSPKPKKKKKKNGSKVTVSINVDNIFITKGILIWIFIWIFRFTCHYLLWKLYMELPGM